MILGFLSILLMGVILGLIGAGGSILTVPIFVYLFKINSVLSTSYSLLLVGFTALIGSFFYFRKKKIDFNIAFKFAIPSIITVYLTRRFILPAIPNDFKFLDLIITKDLFILSLFSFMMFLTSFFMIKNSDKKSKDSKKKILINPYIKNILIVFESSLIGVLTALIGAGGGFLIVPALVLLNKIDIKSAIGTSLVIIALKSIFGFIGDIQSNVNLDYFLAFYLIITASIGIYFGLFLGKYFDSNYIKKGFGYFVMVISIIIIIKETLL